MRVPPEGPCVFAAARAITASRSGPRSAPPTCWRSRRPAQGARCHQAHQGRAASLRGTGAEAGQLRGGRARTGSSATSKPRVCAPARDAARAGKVRAAGWRDRVFVEIRRSDIARLLDPVEDKHGRWMADSVLSVLRALATWYASRDDNLRRRPLSKTCGATRRRIASAPAT